MVACNESHGSLDRLVSGSLAGVDASLEQHLAGPRGSDLRLAYLLEQLAKRVCNDDYAWAARLLDRPHPDLYGRAPREVAATDAGMLAVRRLIAQMEWHRRHRHFGAVVQAVDDRWVQEFTLLLDLLPLAWGLSDAEFEQLLEVTPMWLSQWRAQSGPLGPQVRERLRRLRSFHDALRLVVSKPRTCVPIVPFAEVDASGLVLRGPIARESHLLPDKAFKLGICPNTWRR